ncbi:hypothetical protein FA13DRAFT_1716245 [Coprinellus micaceus]|uniref:Fungal-type protein kinase domain-containing protein n=1 Tax=Coprinellus micaceus TaxID=71717 RepID=A0A4Y7SK29_COPMI|nr:hypothetical protein FA13DRAFT_1716245 [Coprinellus micaceus]
MTLTVGPDDLANTEQALPVRIWGGLRHRIRGGVCTSLFEEFHGWATKMVDEKDRYVFREGRRGRADILDPLHAHRDEHHAAVLRMFDHAINTIRDATPSSPTVVEVDALPARPASESPLPTKDTDQASPKPLVPSKKSPDADPPSVAALPATPPRVAAPLSPYTSPSPSTPRPKRASEEGEHPHSPRAKSRRIRTGPLVTSRSP